MTTSIADDLRRIVPQGALPPSYVHSEYAIDGLSPMAVVVPEDRKQVADVMRWAAESGVTVFPRGGGTKTALGNPPDSVGLVLDLSRLNRIIDYQPGDMTATVEAGITLNALQRSWRRPGSSCRWSRPCRAGARWAAPWPLHTPGPWPTPTARPATGSSASAW